MNFIDQLKSEGGLGQDEFYSTLYFSFITWQKCIFMYMHFILFVLGLFWSKYLSFSYLQPIYNRGKNEQNLRGKNLNFVKLKKIQKWTF